MEGGNGVRVRSDVRLVLDFVYLAEKTYLGSVGYGGHDAREAENEVERFEGVTLGFLEVMQEVVLDQGVVGERHEVETEEKRSAVPPVKEGAVFGEHPAGLLYGVLDDDPGTVRSSYGSGEGTRTRSDGAHSGNAADVEFPGNDNVGEGNGVRRARLAVHDGNLRDEVRKDAAEVAVGVTGGSGAARGDRRPRTEVAVGSSAIVLSNVARIDDGTGGVLGRIVDLRKAGIPGNDALVTVGSLATVGRIDDAPSAGSGIEFGNGSLEGRRTREGSRNAELVFGNVLDRTAGKRDGSQTGTAGSSARAGRRRISTAGTRVVRLEIERGVAGYGVGAEVPEGVLALEAAGRMGSANVVSGLDAGDVPNGISAVEAGEVHFRVVEGSDAHEGRFRHEVEVDGNALREEGRARSGRVGKDEEVVVGGFHYAVGTFSVEVGNSIGFGRPTEVLLEGIPEGIGGVFPGIEADDDGGRIVVRKEEVLAVVGGEVEEGRLRRSVGKSVGVEVLGRSRRGLEGRGLGDGTEESPSKVGLHPVIVEVVAVEGDKLEEAVAVSVENRVRGSVVEDLLGNGVIEDAYDAGSTLVGIRGAVAVLEPNFSQIDVAEHSVRYRLMMTRTNSTTGREIHAVIRTSSQLIRGRHGRNRSGTDAVLEIRSDANDLGADGKRTRESKVSVGSGPITFGVSTSDVPLLGGSRRGDGFKGGDVGKREEARKEGEEEDESCTHGKEGLDAFFLTFSGEPLSGFEHGLGYEDEGGEEEERDRDDDGGEGKGIRMVVSDAPVFVEEGDGIGRGFGLGTGKGERDGDRRDVRTEDRDAREGLGIGVMVMELGRDGRKVVTARGIEIGARLGEPHGGNEEVRATH